MNELTLWLVPKSITFAPRNEAEEILQNVLTICTTMKYSCPLDREFGVEAGYLDDAVNSARAKIASEIVNAVRKFEPRAKIQKIDFEYNTEHSKIIPKIQVGLR